MIDGESVRIRGGCIIHAPDCARPDLSGVKLLKMDGDLVARCRHCISARWVPNTPPAVKARWVLLCCRCGTAIRRFSGRAVVPLCPSCAAEGRRRRREEKR